MPVDARRERYTRYQGKREEVRRKRGEESIDKKERQETREGEGERMKKNRGVCIEQPVSIARGFTLSSPFLSSPPSACVHLFFLFLFPLVFSCCSSSVCGEPQIIRINIITSSGAASLFLSPRSTHHDVTHDRFRAPVKPLSSSSSSSPSSSAPLAFLPIVDSFYLAAASSIANSTGP